MQSLPNQQLPNQQLSSQTLHQLAEPVTAPCVSIFLPIERGSYDQRAARLELKNLLATARASVRQTLKPL